MMYKKNGVAMKGTMNGWESKLWCTTKIALPWKALWMHEKIIWCTAKMRFSWKALWMVEKISYDVQQRWCCYERHYKWVGK